MSLEEIVRQVKMIPEAAGLPELYTVFEQAKEQPQSDWRLPLVACQAVGGEPDQAMPLAAAVACLMISILLVDDILDDDPRGEHLRRGTGQAANLALAFEAAAFRLVAQAPVSPVRQAAITASLAHLALQSAAGQVLDIQNLSGEENYWKVIRTKSTPFYGSALEVGAIAGGATPELARQMYELGVQIGEILQIEDDFTDAFETPANADWLQGRNNLLILYARTADHEQKERFAEIRSQTSDPALLKEAQQILFASGAASYVVHLLVKRYQLVREMVGTLPLVNPEPIVAILDRYRSSLNNMLQSLGVDNVIG
jgi:geranylgeranyl pyrophosphate synthase